MTAEHLKDEIVIFFHDTYGLESHIQQTTNNYLHIVILTAFMGYPDDNYFLFVGNKPTILEIQMESRLGIGDLGANKMRATSLTTFLKTASLDSFDIDDV